jgi:hypothetical protein
VYWPIDIYGHSAYTPTIINELGYDIVFLSQIGSARKNKLLKQKNMHFNWRGHSNNGKEAEVFVNVLP